MPIFRKILAIDTSRGEASVALLDGSEVVAQGSAGPPAETLLGLIETLGDDPVDLVVVGLGPGSFTGTRVGLATAKGLAIARGVPVVGVCSLVGLARSLGEGVHSVLGDAGRNQVYAATYRIQEDAPAEERVAPHLEDALTVRPPLTVRPHDFGREPVADLAIHLGREGRMRAERDGVDEVAELEPLYVRASDAKLPSKPLKVQASSSSSSSDT